jgi:TldD protein
MINRRRFLQTAGAVVIYSAIPSHPGARAREGEGGGESGPGGVFSTPDGARALAGSCLDLLRKLGAGYGDIRIGHYRRQSLAARDERLESAEEAESSGFGVRVLDRGAWGFAASNRLTAAEVERVTREAVAIARASALAMKEPVTLAPEPVHRERRYDSPCVQDPFAVPLAEKVELLLAVNAALKRGGGVKVAESSMGFSRRQQLFASLEGSWIETVIVRSRAGESATAVGEGDSQDRSYDIPAANAGYEHIVAGDLAGQAERVGAEAVEKLRAAPSPGGTYDLILDPHHLSLVIHESCGHASELDRALGYEANYAGTSFLSPDMMGSFKYGSKLVNLVADNVRPGSLASLGFDDEGVECQRWDIVREGTFVGFSDNREVAPKVGSPRSHGSCRADSWGAIPIVRIANVGLEPGNATLDALLADTKRGIYIEGSGSWSIDQRRWNMQFGGDAFWEIVDGKRTRMLKNVIYQSNTPEFWGACDAVCDQSHWRAHGFLNCGKGQPGQSGHMTHGASHARIRGMKVLPATT